MKRAPSRAREIQAERFLYCTAMMAALSQTSIDAFHRDGFLVARGLFAAESTALRDCAAAMLDPLLAPAEFEADVGYPGAPASRIARGGLTPRRLLHAYSRDPSLRAVGTDVRLGRHLAAMVGSNPCLSQSHHNCIMTKFPSYSSRTDWHQDIRYWSFEHAELVSAWIALGREQPVNGGLKVIPGSHRLALSEARYDEARFLRTDLADNAALIANAVDVELEPGDVLFFHCRLFHAAGSNHTDLPKLSLVFTYHDAANRPLAGSRSALYPSVPVSIV